MCKILNALSGAGVFYESSDLVCGHMLFVFFSFVRSSGVFFRTFSVVKCNAMLDVVNMKKRSQENNAPGACIERLSEFLRTSGRVIYCIYYYFFATNSFSIDTFFL